MISCALYVSYALTLALINHLLFFSSIVFPSSVCLNHFVTRLPDLEPPAHPAPSCPVTFLFFFTTMKPLHMLFSLLVGDCRVHCSTSSDGGQWPWGSLFIRWAGFLPSFPYSQQGPWCWAGISDHRPKKLLDSPLRKQLLSLCSVCCHSNPLHPQLMYQHNMSHSTFPLLDLNGLIAFWGLLHYLSCRESVVWRVGAVVCGVYNMHTGCTSAAYPPPGETD